MVSGRTSGMTLCSSRACFAACVFAILEFSDKLPVCKGHSKSAALSVQVIPLDCYTYQETNMPEESAHYERSRIMHYCFGERSALVTAQPGRCDRSGGLGGLSLVS